MDIVLPCEREESVCIKRPLGGISLKEKAILRCTDPPLKEMVHFWLHPPTESHHLDIRGLIPLSDPTKREVIFCALSG
jgi:hypothetical protein